MKYLSCLSNRNVVLISHDLSQTGAPMLLVETAVQMQKSGAKVSLVNLGRNPDKRNLATRNGIRIVPVHDSLRLAANADLVIANTAVVKTWVRSHVAAHPAAARRLVWWIHEIDAKAHAENHEHLDKVACLLFDSHASLGNWRALDIRLPRTSVVVHPSVRDGLREVALGTHFPFEPSKVLRALGIRRSQSRRAIRQRLGIEEDDFVISLFGSFIPAKGHRLFVRTVQRMLGRFPTLALKLMIIGFWNERQRHEFLDGLTETGRRVLEPCRALMVVGDLSPYYAASDALVMNSQGLGENFGRVTVEAMAFGLPVLGTNAGGTPEIVVDGITGLLYPVGEKDQEQLAEHIRLLVENRERAKALGEAGFNRVREHFTDARFYGELGSIIEGVLNRVQ